MTYAGDYHWIADGNDGGNAGCVSLRRIDFIKDGKLASDIGSFSVLDSGLFGYIAKKTF